MLIVSSANLAKESRAYGNGEIGGGAAGDPGARGGFRRLEELMMVGGLRKRVLKAGEVGLRGRFREDVGTGEVAGMAS